MTAISRLAMVYDADGGVVGETKYVVRHLFGSDSCSLCSITHRGIRRKSDFEDLLAMLPVPAEVLHRNEQDVELRSATAGVLPCVVARVDERWELLVDREALEACRGDVGRFSAVLTEALSART